MRISLIRRVASLLFVLAFVASAQLHAMPMMGSAKTVDSVSGMMHGSPSDSCKGCGQSGAPAKADCTAMCGAVFALALPVPTDASVDRESVLPWTSEILATRSIAPDTSPPRA